MADPDERLRALEERIARLERRIDELEAGGLEQAFTDIGRVTAAGGRKAAKAAEGLLHRGIDAMRRNSKQGD